MNYYYYYYYYNYCYYYDFVCFYYYASFFMKTFIKTSWVHCHLGRLHKMHARMHVHHRNGNVTAECMANDEDVFNFQTVMHTCIGCHFHSILVIFYIVQPMYEVFYAHVITYHGVFLFKEQCDIHHNNLFLHSVTDIRNIWSIRKK